MTDSKAMRVEVTRISNNDGFHELQLRVDKIEAQARIAELEATVKGYLGAITDSAGGAPNMHRPAQIALLKLQAVIDWPTKGNGDAIRASLGDEA